MVVKKILFVFVFCLTSFVLSAETYVGLSGSLLLPQGGSRMHHVGGATVRGGYDLTEDWALEGEAAWLEDAAGLSVTALGHFQGWSLYGDLFGYSRFDPFVTLGAKGWIGHGGGQVGPKAGLGAFYHLTESLDVRVDAQALLACDAPCGMLYSVCIGLQWNFGGAVE